MPDRASDPSAGRRRAGTRRRPAGCRGGVRGAPWGVLRGHRRVEHGHGGEDLVHPGEQFRLQLHAGGLDVLGDLLGPGGADDRGRHVGVLQHPGDGQLGEREPRLVGERAQQLDALQHVVAQPAGDEVRAALVVGGAGAGRRLHARPVLAGEHTLRDRRPDHLAEAQLLGHRHDFALDDPPQRAVLRLVGDERDAQLAGERVAGPDLVGGPLGHADVQRLAGADHVGERLHGLLQRSRRVVAVRLVDVDVVGLQAAQRVVDRLHDVLAAQPAVVAAGAGRPEHLGEDLQPLTALALEGPAEDRLGAGLRVHVGRVEGGDARVEGGPDAGGRGLLLDLRAMGEPIAVGDLTDDQAAAAQVTEFHEPYGTSAVTAGVGTITVPRVPGAGRHRAAASTPRRASARTRRRPPGRLRADGAGVDRAGRRAGAPVGCWRRCDDLDVHDSECGGVAGGGGRTVRPEKRNRDPPACDARRPETADRRAPGARTVEPAAAAQQQRVAAAGTAAHRRPVLAGPTRPGHRPVEAHRVRCAGLAGDRRTGPRGRHAGPRPGRTAVLYRADAGAGHVLGMDVGRARLRVAVADLAGRVVARRTSPTAAGPAPPSRTRWSPPPATPSPTPDSAATAPWTAWCGR
ncbi:hypothetical protein KCH_69570 [Kitasatospora cheerisanensis KCTC 2395]|uniref:Uncharacterized protein n=1 Tax=Kitasatospora cheerisanensis KCTC 2395 TaxID=1348663 RepID=A0A066YTT4_9ACTN|nr:hypothetical protein KCH_69570 [Kitasatospora cheerisanensis KCTC 2395]